MLNFKRHALLLSLAFICVLPGFTQTVPCPPGTLANVLGTSCSIGRIIFNFQNNFAGSVQVNGLQTIISPAQIGFVPIQDDHHAGFKLLLNFSDGPGGDSTFSEGHVFGFSYNPQAATGSEIRAQDLSIDAAAHGAPSSIAAVQGSDIQSYPNSQLLQTFTSINIQNNVTVSDQLSNKLILEVPGLLSTSTGAELGFPTTTQISDGSTGSASVELTSVTILYTAGPVVPVPRPAALTYTNIDLPGVATTTALNITDTGKIVGFYQDVVGATHGYTAEPDGSFTTIDVPGAASTFAQGLNERGDVVGGYTDDAGITHGFLRRDGNFTTIDVPQAISTLAIAINNRGQVVGQYEVNSDPTVIPVHGFVLDDGVFTTIDHGSGADLIASQAIVGINNRSEITGFFFDPSTFRSFTQRSDFFRTLDVPGQGNTLSEGINEAGDLVGIYSDLNLVQHGFVRLGAGFRTVDFPGGIDTIASGINDFGKIVGTYSDSAGNTHSFLGNPANHDPDDGDQALSLATSSVVPTGAKPPCGSEDWRRRKAKVRGSNCR
jgi:hypothetical protein